jgi:hypothetical protein
MARWSVRAQQTWQSVTPAAGALTVGDGILVVEDQSPRAMHGVDKSGQALA